MISDIPLLIHFEIRRRSLPVSPGITQSAGSCLEPKAPLWGKIIVIEYAISRRGEYRFEVINPQFRNL